MVRFGLLGAGRIGKIHGGNIASSPKAKLVAVADADAGAAKSLASATGAEVQERRRRSSPPGISMRS